MKVGITRMTKLKSLRASIYYSQKIADAYENLEDYNQTKKWRVLIVFDDVIADMKSNKILSPIVSEFFSIGIKPTITILL